MTEPLPLVPNPTGLAIDADEIVAVQLDLSYAQRKAMAPEIAKRVNSFAAEMGVAPPDPAPGAVLAGSLEEMGFARLGKLLDDSAVADVLTHFSSKPCFNAHVYAQSDRTSHTRDELAQSAYFACYRQDDVVTAPHLLSLANDPKILSAVASYLGCVPALYSMNAWWSFPRPESGAGLTQAFHRDEDDLKNCVLFIYLTDVGLDGCHEYIRASHRPDAMARHLGRAGRHIVEIEDAEGRRRVAVEFKDLFTGHGYGGDAVYRKLFGALVEPIEGRAGEAFLSDPDGLHRARHPEGRRRLIVWIRYGLARNRAYIQDRLEPVSQSRLACRLPNTAQVRFINRLVVTPD